MLYIYKSLYKLFKKINMTDNKKEIQKPDSLSQAKTWFSSHYNSSKNSILTYWNSITKSTDSYYSKISTPIQKHYSAASNFVKTNYVFFEFNTQNEKKIISDKTMEYAKIYDDNLNKFIEYKNHNSFVRDDNALTRSRICIYGSLGLFITFRIFSIF